MRRYPAIFLFLLVLATAFSGCKSDSKSAADKPTQSYTVRGELKAVGENEMTIHHEAIADFRGIKGDISPMMSMSMPFGVADGVKTKHLAPGVKLEFTFTVDFKRDPVPQITGFKVLGDDETLELSGY